MSLARFVAQESVRVKKTIRRADTFLDQARCPWCRHPLIARVGKKGPYFHCGCTSNAGKESSPHAPREVSSDVKPDLPFVATSLSNLSEVDLLEAI